MKKITAVLFLSLLLLSVFTACKKQAPDNKDSELPDDTKTKIVSFTVADIATDLIDNAEFPDMYTMSDSEIERQFGFSAGQFTEVYAAAADQYPGIERIFLGKLKNPEEDKTETVDALNRYLETLKAEYIDYVPSEYDKAKNVSVYEKDDYVCLVIAKDSDSALKIVKNYIK